MRLLIMVAMPSGVLILFALSSLMAFLLPFIKDRFYKQLSLAGLVKSLPAFLLTAAPMCALYAIGWHFKVDAAASFPYFIGALTLAFVLSRTGLPAQLRGILILAGAVPVTLNLPVDNTHLPVAAAMMGLISWKFVENLYLEEKSSLDDVLPAIVWFSGVTWLRTAVENKLLPAREGLLLGVMAVAQLLRCAQRPLLHEDKVFLKRIMLASTGGLGVLIVITKLLTAMDLAMIAALVGAGFFTTYLFEMTNDENRYYVTPTSAVKVIVLIGVLTLIATRFFGMFGLVVLAPTALVATRSGVGQFGGLFWITRCLLQTFIVQYNSNVTGINITHAYTGAALYAGFFAIALFALFMHQVKDRKVLAPVFVGGTILASACSNYFLHAEPTSSFLVSATVAGILLATLLPAMQKGETTGQENLLLVPTGMITAAILTSSLINLGNENDIEVRTHVVAYTIGFVLATIGLLWASYKYGKKKEAPPPTETPAT
jgi:hypothetical protein